MNKSTEKVYQCRLCGSLFQYADMSEEHYPARNTGNNDIVELDIVKLFDTFQSDELHSEIIQRLNIGEKFQDITGEIFDKRLARDKYSKGRTARTLCRECNTFLGKYDEAYLRFFNADGDPKIIKGFQQRTKYQIIKAIYAKFLSLPETQSEEFDFLDFVRNADSTDYNGKWHLYFVKRDFSSDLMGMADIGTGKAEFEEGIVYELSDDKFIFNLLDFPKHDCFEMTDIFDILKKNYTLSEGVGEDGGYHAQILMGRLFSEMDLPEFD